jgi:hypothetical protein
MEILVPAVSSRDPGHRYRVILSDDGDECDCPDFYWRHINRGDDNHRCKHIAAARQLLVDGIPGPGRAVRPRSPKRSGQPTLAA